jgi:hypothetical protein
MTINNNIIIKRLVKVTTSLSLIKTLINLKNILIRLRFILTMLLIDLRKSTKRPLL